MSIYRRSDRVPLNDLAIGIEPSVAFVPAGSVSANEDWTRRRRSEPANGLLKPTLAWAATLRPDVQPKALMARFPRIANLMAVLWQDPNSLRRYVDDLLVDKRGDRQGFPLDVLREIFALRAYYDELNTPEPCHWEILNDNR